MKSYIRICLITMFVLITAAAFAEPVTLEYKFTTGGIDKYMMSMDMSMSMPGLSASPMDMSMTVAYTQKTISVNPDGSAKIVTTYSAPTITGSAAAKKSAKTVPLTGQSITMTMSKRGQVLSIEGMDKLLAASGLKNMDFSSLFSSTSSQALLPEGPVEVGQSWSQNIPMPFGGSKMMIVSSLESNDQMVWNQPAAKINQSYNGVLDLGGIMKAMSGSITDPKQSAALSSVSGAVDMKGNMVFLFGTAIGKLLKGEGNMQATVNINLPVDATKPNAPRSLQMSMNMRMSLTRTK